MENFDIIDSTEYTNVVIGSSCEVQEPAQPAEPLAENAVILQSDGDAGGEDSVDDEDDNDDDDDAPTTARASTEDTDGTACKLPKKAVTVIENHVNTNGNGNESESKETIVLTIHTGRNTMKVGSETSDGDNVEINPIKSEDDIEQVIVEDVGELVADEEEELLPAGTQIVVVVPEEKSEIIEDSKIEDITSEEIHQSVLQDIKEDDEDDIPVMKTKFMRKYGNRRQKDKIETTVEEPIPPPELGRTRSKKNLKSAAVKLETLPEKKKSDKKKEDIPSEDEKCRICLSIDGLTSIFHSVDDPEIADKIMAICTGVKIIEKDFLPQYICRPCLDSLNVALKFKALCEHTDKELRSKLKRSKNKIRRPTEFVLIDCDDMSESEEEIKLNDDEEFHLSHESEVSAIDSDSDSDFSVNKRRTSRRSTRGRRKSSGVGRMRNNIRQKSPRQGKRGRRRRTDVLSIDNVVYLKAEEQSTDDEQGPPKKRRSLKLKKTDDDGGSTPPDHKKKEFECVYCNEVFKTLISLREHKRSHAGQKPFTCHICNKAFKLPGSFNSHLKRHQEEDILKCTQCDKQFINKTEQRRHMVDEHGEPAATFVCEKCKRAFTTAPRLERHKESKCPGFEMSPNNKKIKPEIDPMALGKDLFKCVAPMTTTYWSDSFSD